MVKVEEEESEKPVSEIVRQMSERQRQRMEVIQELLAVPNAAAYREGMQAAAARLKLSVSSIQRLVREWKKEGVAGLSWRERSDRGRSRISKDWQEYIVKTYREGNLGSRSLSPAQVAVRVKVRAAEKGLKQYPSHMTVYRVLKPLIEQAEQPKRSLGWRGGRLMVRTRDGREIEVERSNQVWQADHRQVDVLVVDQSGAVLGRPWLTLVVDSYSRCIMGIHLGFDAPSAVVVCLALRHAILPKQYSSGYEMRSRWETYGLPQYLYTDLGKDFTSGHLEQVATELGIGLCHRLKPSDGGIVERPFGTFNRELFSSIPGYVSSKTADRSPVAEREASITLIQLEQLLVRYIVDRYNQGIDARMGDQSRSGRWEAGLTVQLPLLGERELDICLMRRERRRVYRGGYLQFANLSYRGEHLEGYSGEAVIIRYNPRDITTVLVYQPDGKHERFVARAHAVGLETESLSYREAQAISGRLRQVGRAISNESMLLEVRDRDLVVEQLRREKRRKRSSSRAKSGAGEREAVESDRIKPPSETTAPAEGIERAEGAVDTTDNELEAEIVIGEVVVHDYEEWKQEYGKWW